MLLNTTIASGASVSSTIDLGVSGTLGEVLMPASWTAADLAFQVDPGKDGSWRDLYDQYGSVIVVKAAASRAIRLPIGEWLADGYLRLKSVSQTDPTTAVNQTAARTVGLVAVR